MQVKRTGLSETKVKLSITADNKFLDSTKQHVLTHIGSQHLKIPGFREGKAPLNLIEKHVDQTRLQNEFLEEAVNRLYPQALEAENLRPVANPNVSIVKFVPFTTLEFEVEVEVIGEVKLPDYKKMKKAKKPISTTAKDIEDVLSSLKTRSAERIEVKRPAKNGDEVLIDFKGVDDKGQAVNGAEGKDYPLVLGSDAFIPGFEPNLVGLKAAGNKKFDITFPKDYGVKALANKKVTFEVAVKKVSQLKEPALDDKFAAQAGPFKTLTELKADIKKQLTAERQTEADRAFENELLQEIAENTIVNIPKVLVDEQIERGEKEERQNLAYRGQTWEEHLREEVVTAEEHRERNRPSAKQAVRTSLALTEIAQLEKIKVSSEELEIRIQLLKGQYKDPTMQAELDKPENRQDIASRLITEKTIAKIVDYVTKN
jgi:trigger factor